MSSHLAMEKKVRDLFPEIQKDLFISIKHGCGVKKNNQWCNLKYSVIPYPCEIFYAVPVHVIKGQIH